MRSWDAGSGSALLSKFPHFGRMDEKTVYLFWQVKYKWQTCLCDDNVAIKSGEDMRLFCTEKGLQISGYRFLIIVLKVRLVVIIAEKKYAGSPRHYFKTPPKLTQFYKKVHFFAFFWHDWLLVSVLYCTFAPSKDNRSPRRTLMECIRWGERRTSE